MRTVGTFLSILCIVLNAIAAEPPVPPAEKIRILHIELSAIIAPEKLVFPLLDDFNDETKMNAAFAKVQAAIGRGEATVAATVFAQGEPWRILSSETCEEVKYATEFEAPKYPNLDSKKDLASLPKDVKSIALTPTAFETRNVGMSLEVSQVEFAKDWQHLKFLMAAQHVRFLGWDEFDAGITPQGVRIVAKQPRFFSAKNNSTISLRVGGRALAGIHKLPDQPKTFELFFIRAWTTTESKDGAK